MKGIVLIIFAAVLFGIIHMVYGSFRLPDSGNSRLMMRSVLQVRKGSMSYEIFVYKLAKVISSMISLGHSKKERMEKMLAAANIDMTPETYVAMGIVRVVNLVLAGVLFWLLASIWKPFAVAAGICFLFSITQYLDQTKALERDIVGRRNEIEYELPRFVNTVATELKYNRDMVRIIEKYIKSSEGSFRHELQITVADMKSGNQELALKRLEGRVSSAMLSQVIRGLIGVIRGDDGIFYFNMLAHDFKVLEQERLRSVAKKQPDKMKKYIFAVVICFIVLLFVSLALSMLDKIQAMF